MRDQNQVRISGTIFWSKLDDRQTYSTLRLGINIPNSGSVFASVNNPSTKAYDLIKTGNKVVLSGVLDTWEKKEGGTELQIKANDSGVQFFGKEKSIPEFNSVVCYGKILEYAGDTAVVQMYGERNPKTDSPTIRKARIKIGDSFKDIVNSNILLEAKIKAEEIEGKSKMFVEADYDKVCIV